MTDSPYLAGDDGAPRKIPDLRKLDCRKAPAHRGPRSKKPTTDSLWKEFVARSVPKPPKTDHRQTVEGAWS